MGWMLADVRSRVQQKARAMMTKGRMGLTVAAAALAR
jgi:hypothetical protein